MKPFTSPVMNVFLFSLLLLIPGWTGHSFSQTNVVLGFRSGTTNHTRILKLAKKPAKFDSFIDRIEFVHDNLQLTLQQHIDRADVLLADGSIEKVQTPPSRFRITPSMELGYDRGGVYSFDPDFEAEVDLPNMERRCKVFLENARGDDLPGLNIFEQDKGSQLGLRRIWDEARIRTSVGVKTRLPPEAFARAEWMPQYTAGIWVLQPRQQVFYESSEGVGSLTSMTCHKWLGARYDKFFQSVTAGKYSTKGTDGVEFEQTLKAGWITEALEDKWTWRRTIGERDMARGHILSLGAFGHVSSDEEEMDLYRVSYIYRCPLYKNWIYLEVAPGLDYTADADDEENGADEAQGDNIQDREDWRLVPAIRLGVDMLFWGTYER